MLRNMFKLSACTSGFNDLGVLSFLRKSPVKGSLQTSDSFIMIDSRKKDEGEK